MADENKDNSFGQSNPSMPYTGLVAGNNGSDGSNMRDTPNANPNTETDVGERGTDDKDKNPSEHKR
jgi:hypothetical protein